MARGGGCMVGVEFGDKGRGKRRDGCMVGVEGARGGVVAWWG